MQTFMPYADYKASAKTLDMKRLGKQRVETLQVLQVLLQERLITSDKVTLASGRVVKVPRPREQWEREPITKKGWSHHPAVLMWKGHELELLKYQEACCEEWTSRGFKDTCLEKSRFLVEPHREELSDSKPKWLGDEEFHLSHRSNLRRKDDEHYAELFPEVSAELPYKWPVSAASL